MTAPASERAPRMLLVIGEDEQGLPTETIILEPSISQVCEALRVWLVGLLPNWLVHALGLARAPHVSGLPISESVLIDARVRWAGL
jgi:hypothetical protein